MADAPDAPNLDPKAALAKYDYKGADEDQKAINKVESAIAAHFPASFTAGLAEKSANAPIKEDEVHGKIEKAKADANEKAANDEDAKKELKADPSAKNPPAGAAVKPEVKASHPAKPPAFEAKKGGAGGAGPAGAGKAGGKGAKGSGHDVGSAPTSIALQAANTGEADLDSWLDKYPKKSHEPTERLSKIKEMSAVAKGFDGQLEKYVDGSGKVDSATSKLSNFLGKKEVTAAFGDNPYAKVEGGLGQIMRGISRFANVVSIVGNVCTKIGLVLTVVGLLGMILPPIGAAVSAVARVLNVVGIICDVLGVVLGGVLTGLNGVVLAKQIAKGASNEEKAATADMMVSEATSVGGHVLSLAMTYGPGFMKGFKSASKNVIGNLFAKFKGVVGKFAGKALGPVANWAKNIGYKMGIGLEKEAKVAGSGLLSKVWKSPGTALEKLRDTKVVKAINNSAVMKGLERGAGKLDNVGWVNKIDGAGEGLGKLAGGKAAGFSQTLKKSAEEDAKVIAVSIERNTGRDAANRERETIDRDITRNREAGNNQLAPGENGRIPQDNVRRSDAAYAKADELEAGKAQAIANAEKDEGKAAKKEYEEGRKDAKRDAKADEKKEALEEKRVEEFKKDPKKYQNETAAQEGRLKSTEQKLENPNLAAEEKDKLEHTAHSLEKTIQERKMVPLVAGGGESPENLAQLKGLTEGINAAKGIAKGGTDGNWKDEKGENAEKYTKVVEKKSGHAAREEDEKAERHDKIGEFQAEHVEHADVAEHVEGMLQGLDEELGFEADSGGEEGGHHEGDESAMVDLPGDEGGASAANDEAKHDEPAAPAPQTASAAEPAEPKHEEEKEKAPDPGELAYWPKLTGEFAQAAIELNRMKAVAYAFKKQQAEARKKAYEAATTYSDSGKDAEKKADAAKQHTAAIGPTIDEAKTNSAKAGEGSAQADKGSGEQGKGSGASSTPAPTPDAGEKPSRWHPIKRLWWCVKKWASEKATAVFGWIQNQIASLVLEGLCGVSMGDMKAYTEALRHRMEFSKISGTQGLDAAKRAMAESGKNKGESKSYEQQALADAADCDQSMADADSFASSVETTQQELVAEQAKAKAFLASLKTAVAADRQQQAAEKAKKAAEAKAATAGTAAPGATATVAAPTPKAKVAGKPKQSKPLSPAATGKVKNAASYVVTKANGLLETFVDMKSRQTDRLKGALAKQPEFVRGQFETITVGNNMVAAFRSHTSSVAASLDKVKGASPTTASELHGHAGQVKSKAKQLDEDALHAHEALNEAFKATYAQINAVSGPSGPSSSKAA